MTKTTAKSKHTATDYEKLSKRLFDIYEENLKTFIRELEKHDFLLKSDTVLMTADIAGKYGILIYKALVKVYGKRHVDKCLSDVLKEFHREEQIKYRI